MIKCHSDVHCKSETIRYCASTRTRSSSSCSCYFRKFKVGAIRILNCLEIYRNELRTSSCSVFLNRGTVPYKRTLRFDFKGSLFSSVITIMGPFGDHGKDIYFGNSLTPIDFNFYTWLDTVRISSCHKNQVNWFKIYCDIEGSAQSSRYSHCCLNIDFKVLQNTRDSTGKLSMDSPNIEKQFY